MSISVTKPTNVGAYTKPYSGVGVEYSPLETAVSHPSPLLHEIGYQPRNKDWNFPSVLSPFWRVYYNLDRGHQVQLDGVVYELEPEYILIIPDHRLFHCEGHKSVRTFWMHFSMPRKVEPEQPVLFLLKPETTELRIIEHISQQMGSEPTPELAARVFHPAMALLHLLLARADIAWKPPLPGTLIRLLEFIDSHLSEKISNTRLANEGGMSAETLVRLFRTRLNVSPAQYVNQVRTSRAGQMLEQTDMTIDYIAEATGFPNRAYFSRVFKQVTTLSPAAFRKRKQAHRKQFD